MIFPSDTNVGNASEIIYHACCCQGLSRAAALLSSPHHLCQHTKAGGPMRLLAAAGPSWISFNGSHTAVQDHDACVCWRGGGSGGWVMRGGTQRCYF
jgi:hypothetical protein